MSQEHGDRTAIPVAPVGPQDLTLVSKTDYDKLLLISRQYANLRANLMSGGVAEETITVSISPWIVWRHSVVDIWRDQV